MALNHRDRTFAGEIAATMEESTPWWPEPVTAPAGAPNIILVLLDDMGFSDIGPFGGEIPTPTLDRLAAGGLRYTNYHTTPICSASRAALLSGLNPHRAGYGFVANANPGFPGMTMELADDVATLPETLREAGYATFAVGKWHLTLDTRMHDGASRDSWPCQRGFDRFYGTLEGLTNLHHPHRLVSDNASVTIDEFPEGYYFTDDITDAAIGMIDALRTHEPDKPFFLYQAHCAVHGPLHALAEDLAEARGRYDVGWDEIRRARFARQITQGLFPADTVLPARNTEPGNDVTAWDDLPAGDRELFPRYMEAYAAMVANVDRNLGRLLDAVEQRGELDNTIVIFTSDNGGTAEGGERGTRSYFKLFGNRFPDEFGLDVPRDPDLIGGPQSLVHYPRGWGMASNTPFRLYKTQTHAGGVRVPMVLHWPAGLDPAAGGTFRRQYQYVNDLFPTLLDLAGVAPLTQRHNLPVQPLDGASFADSLADPGAASTHPEQYSECQGSRSYYRDGYKLVALHTPGASYDGDVWELYDIEADPTEADDLAGVKPEKVEELRQAWDEAAARNNAIPLPHPLLVMGARPPWEDETPSPLVLRPGSAPVERSHASRFTAFRSFVVEIDLEQVEGAEGVLVAHGDQGGGYSLYVEDGRLHLAYNEYGELLGADAALPVGNHAVRLVVDALPGFLWNLSVEIDGVRAAGLDGVVMMAGLAPFSGIDVGLDRGSPVSWPVYERHGCFRYGGGLRTVTYMPGESAPYAPAKLVEAMRAAASRFE